ncbi:hypothetical protein IM40_02445 [Candidatus Paracaedimonas acanthamoebae]|nr:hypothetical protein IM40_02445 [Candidatus Paracaedimonas acanthamoebae]
MFEKSCILPLSNLKEDLEYISFFAIVNSPLDQLEKDCWPWLTNEDKKYLNNCSATRKQSFLAGRKAVYIASKITNENPVRQIHYGILGYPFESTHQRQISIAHAQGIGAALLYPYDIKIGIDLESYSEHLESLPIQIIFNKREFELIQSINICKDTIGKLIVWSCKEALSKALQCGLSISFEALSIESIICLEDSIFEIKFTHFHAFNCYSWISGNLCLSIALPNILTFKHLTMPSDLLKQCK